MTQEIFVDLYRLHPGQVRAKKQAKRFNVLVCGRRWGKTAFSINEAIETALHGKFVGWFAPEYKRLWDAFDKIKKRLGQAVVSSNQTTRIIEVLGGGRIEFWSLEDEDAGRSREYDLAIIDEAGLVMNLAEIWRKSIRATLLDRKGKAWMVGTPKPPAALPLDQYDFYNFFKRAERSEQWSSYTAPSSDRPSLSKEEIEEMRNEPGMTSLAARQEIDAEFVSQSANALWNLEMIDSARVDKAPKSCEFGVFLDPATTSNEHSDESGIVVVGRNDAEYYVVLDRSGKYTPDQFASIAVELANAFGCPIYYEQNQGGDFVKATIRQKSSNVSIKGFAAVNSKPGRAMSVLGLYEQGRVHHVRKLEKLENEMCNWDPFDPKSPSPNRADAVVHGLRVLSKAQSLGTRKTERIKTHDSQRQSVYSS